MNAIIYCRFSPRPGAETCESIETQLERCKALIIAKGWTLAGEYQDRELSGGRADNRPGLQDALNATCEHKAVLVVYSLSRLARNTRDAIAIADRLAHCGADLFSLSESIDTTSATGRFTFTLFAALATLEREQIKERTSDAMKRHQDHGRIMGRAERLPYGYKRNPENPTFMIIDETEQQNIKSMIEMYKSGLTSWQIVGEFTQRGIKCRGGRWYHTTVANVIRKHHLSRLPAALL